MFNNKYSKIQFRKDGWNSSICHSQMVGSEHKISQVIFQLVVADLYWSEIKILTCLEGDSAKVML